MAECPYCKSSPAYVSLSVVECSNEKCDYYSKELYAPAAVEQQNHDEGDEDHECRTQWIWSTHHHDFGD